MVLDASRAALHWRRVLPVGRTLRVSANSARAGIF
jgi:hypothetical protein